MENDERPYTTGEIAAMSHVTINAVKKWIGSGKLQAFRTPGGHFRINRNDFKLFIEKYRFHIKEEIFPTVHKILIADDSPEIVELVRKSIEMKFGASCVIESADNGYTTLIKMGTFKPELLILDIRMPQIDGIEACRRIRSDASLRDAKIIAITAFGKDELDKIKRAGADMCLAKPLNIVELQSAIATLLGTERRKAVS